MCIGEDGAVATMILLSVVATGPYRISCSNCGFASRYYLAGLLHFTYPR